MSAKPLFVRIDERLLEAFEKYCEARGLMKKDAIETAIKMLLNAKEEEKAEALATDIKELTWSKPLPVKYPNKYCIKCRKQLEIGELALIGKGPQGYMYLCYECYLKVNEKADKDIQKVYKAYKEYRKVKLMLEQASKELREITDKINIYEQSDKVFQILDKLNEMLADLEEYMRKVEHNVDLRRIREELERILEDLDKIAEFIHFFIKKKKKKKPLEVEEYV